MTEPSVRRLTGADAADWQRLRLEALSTYPEAFLTTHDEAAAVPLDTVAERLDTGHSFGVFQDAALVGIGSLIPLAKAQTKHRAEIGAFFVQSAAQGSGAAAALMDAIAKGAGHIGVRQLELYVAASNTRAIAFYTRAGFREVGQIPNATLSNGHAETDLIMLRELT
ncbi:GNAT family N-acetyltransferase [Tateyamaria omphalii]|uniref:GNAT family N-acetyltransferase n=1 Tax=Tateyamaria omphalii TaxID=299262 RepID=UPI001C99ADA4|nr:GNAT family protein [Tateyamaria omphalii]MBY5935345.1 GNAT family N-acetyltransferase [Tateyamaria omphalii]